MSIRPATSQNDRSELQQQLFSHGIPELWCPMITHYTSDGAIDASRTALHLAHLAPHVKGFLIPGSTGDGWELSDQEIRQLLTIVLAEVRRLDLSLLVGVLKTDAELAASTIRAMAKWISQGNKRNDFPGALADHGVRGFTVCPPKGKHLTQEQIDTGLTTIFETGFPIALYQLPQVTKNEVGPELFGSLTRRFPNLIFFKDTSGADKIALSDADPAGVFMVRGAEGNYARWLKSNGGPYDGFLLSTANCFAKELHEICELVRAKEISAAHVLSSRVTKVVDDVFGLVKAFPHGNPFATANKAMDHFFAHGARAERQRTPRLHAGVNLPLDIIRATGERLSKGGFMPAKGYLE